MVPRSQHSCSSAGTPSSPGAEGTHRRARGGCGTSVEAAQGGLKATSFDPSASSSRVGVLVFRDALIHSGSGPNLTPERLAPANTYWSHISVPEVRYILGSLCTSAIGVGSGCLNLRDWDPTLLIYSELSFVQE